MIEEAQVVTTKNFVLKDVLGEELKVGDWVVFNDFFQNLFKQVSYISEEKLILNELPCYAVDTKKVYYPETSEICLKLEGVEWTSTSVCLPWEPLCDHRGGKLKTNDLVYNLSDFTLSLERFEDRQGYQVLPLTGDTAKMPLEWAKEVLIPKESELTLDWFKSQRKIWR